jgi:hypothetical protein
VGVEHRLPLRLPLPGSLPAWAGNHRLGGKLQGKPRAPGVVILTFRQLPQGATLSFFDDDEPRTRVRPRSPGPAAIGPPSDPQQLMVRRAAAAGIGLLVVLLLVFGIRGCLNGRQEQALKDYNRDVSAVVQAADTNADDFYDVLSGATATGDDASATASPDVQSEINQLRTRAQALTERAEGLDVPGDMRPAHVNLLLSLSLVHEAIGKVAQKIPAALSTDSATAVPAVRGIAGEMRALDAADVVYNRRTAALIIQVLDENEIGGQVIQGSSFLQNLGWLQPSTVARRIDSQAGRGAGDGASTEPAAGSHGHGLLALSIGDTTLTPGEANSLTTSANVTFNVKVANQGENPEQDVRVRIRITGAGDPLRAEQVIDQTAAGTETTVAVKLGESPPTGRAITITAEVLPVPGEKNTENNRLTFPAIFRRS